MDSLAAPLEVCVNLRLGLENGQSVLRSLKILQAGSKTDLSEELAIVLTAFERGEPLPARLNESSRMHRRALFELIDAGLKGEPIVNQLKELESEILKICQSDIDRFVASLPMKTMIPLMLVQFPAFLLLLLGPIVAELIKGLNS